MSAYLTETDADGTFIQPTAGRYIVGQHGVDPGTGTILTTPSRRFVQPGFEFYDQALRCKEKYVCLPSCGKSATHGTLEIDTLDYTSSPVVSGRWTQIGFDDISRFDTTGTLVGYKLCQSLNSSAWPVPSQVLNFSTTTWCPPRSL